MSLYFHVANVSLMQALVCASDVLFRQDKEAWIKAKYVERKFLKKMCGSEAVVEGSRKSHHWSVKKCRRHNSSIRAPKTRRKYRHDAAIMSPANLSAGSCLVISECICSAVFLVNHHNAFGSVLICIRYKKQVSYVFLVEEQVFPNSIRPLKYTSLFISDFLRLFFKKTYPF